MPGHWRKQMKPEEKALLLEYYGKEAVDQCGVFLVNYHRVWNLFPEQPPEPITEECTMSKLEYLQYLYEAEEIC